MSPDQFLQLPHHPIHSGQIRLVDREEVGDLGDPGLDHLDPVAGGGGGDHHHRVGDLADLQLRLAHPDRLHQNHLPAQSAQQPDRPPGGQGDATEMTTGAHAPNEDPPVEGMPLHADPVPEDGAAGEGTVGVDRQDSDPTLLTSPERGQPVRNSALAAARRSGQADDLGGRTLLGGSPSGQLLDQVPGARLTGLDRRDRLSQRPGVARQQPVYLHAEPW